MDIVPHMESACSRARSRQEGDIMAVHLYLSLIPEALIASMLTPEEFGV